MAVDIFLKLADIKGELIELKHPDEIQVLAWSWGMSQSGTTHEGSGGGAGKVSVQDVSFTHYVDKASPDLLKACATGLHIPEGLLTIRKAGGKDALEYIKVKMAEILVSAVSTGGSGGEDRLTENVSLNFRKFDFKYTPQTEAGAAGTAGISATTSPQPKRRNGDVSLLSGPEWSRMTESGLAVVLDDRLRGLSWNLSGGLCKGRIVFREPYCLRLPLAHPSAPRKMPDLAQGELTAVEAGELVDVDRSELAAATLEPGGDLQRRDFGQAVAIEVAVPEDASPRPVHRLLAARTGLPDSGEG